MNQLRAARVVYQVHAPTPAGPPAGELEAVLARHPVRTGQLVAEAHAGAAASRQARASLPAASAFTPPLEFEAYARLRQARWICRVEATEVEPEDLGYLRAALLVAGELAALTEGTIVDGLAPATLSAADVVRELERPFDPMRHVRVHVEQGPRPCHVHTHGMEKFGHPDFELHGVPPGSVDVARRLLRHVIAAVVAGGGFRPGESTQLCGFRFSFGAGEPDGGGQFSAGSLVLRDFQLAEAIPTPDMEGMLAS